MAKKVKTWLTDDVEAAAGRDVEASQTVSFGLDGATFEIDLCDKNAIKIRNDIERWMQNARRVGGSKRPVKVVKTRSGGNVSLSDGMDAEQKRACREWLRKNTEEYKNLGNRGRLPEAGLALYNARETA